jgi:sulfite reductase (NADPH) flavoprotein alpha-component
LYKRVWFKIHWALGITAGIILFIIGTTGAIMSFEKEILKLINKESYYVSIPADNEKLTTKELLEKFQLSMPEAKMNGISFSNDMTSAVVINVASKENRKGIEYFINPYTAEILPDIKGKEFFGFVLRLHRWLALSNEAREVGKQTVAISTVALIVLLISGIVIHWGKIKKAFFKSFTFKFKRKGPAFLSTLHTAIGMWVIPFYLLAALTGLSWSYEWYNNSLYKIAGVEKPKREAQKPKENTNIGENIQQTRAKESKFDDSQKAIEMFDFFVKGEYSKATLRFPQKGSIYSFNYLDKQFAHYRAMNTLELDTNVWQLLKHEKYEDKPLNEKLIKSILPLHTGEYFGLIGQIGMFLASSFMMVFTITGMMLYYNRKIKHRL